MASLSSINNNDTDKEEGELSNDDDDNYTHETSVKVGSQGVGSRRRRNVDAHQSSSSERYLPRNHNQNHSNADMDKSNSLAWECTNDQAAPFDLRQKLSEKQRVASCTGSWCNSSSVKGFHLSKYTILRDRRSLFVEPEYKNQGLQIEVHYQSETEKARKVKEKPVERMEKSKQDSLFDGRVIEHQRVNDYPVYNSYPSQPPVPLPAAQTQGISYAGSLSDISQNVYAIRCDKRQQKTTTTKAVSGRESSRHVIDSIMQGTSTKTRAEQKQKLLVYYHKLGKKNKQKKKQHEKIRQMEKKLKALVSNYKCVCFVEMEKQNFVSVENQQQEEQLEKIAQLEKELIKEKQNFVSGSSSYFVPNAAPQREYKIDRTAKKRQQSSNITDKNFKRPLPGFSAPYVNKRNSTFQKREDINLSGSLMPQLSKEATDNTNLAFSLPKRQKMITDLQAEPKRKETNRSIMYSSPMNVSQNYRNQQTSAKEIAETHDVSNVMNPAEIQAASIKEGSQGQNESDMMNPAEVQKASIKKSSEGLNQSNMMNSAAILEASAKESTEEQNESDMINPAEVQEASAKESSEGQNESDMMNPAEIQEASN
ncbi:hypothetical protein BsWGS_12318 [Bradybaena similaris]